MAVLLATVILLSVSSGRAVAKRHDSSVANNSSQTPDAIAQAQANLDAVIRRLTAAFETSAEFKTVLDDVDRSQLAYDAAARPVVANLAENTDYQTAVQQSQDAAKAVDAARESPDTSEQAISELAKRAQELRAAVIKIKNDALAADPQVQSANAKLAAANAAIRKLRQQFQVSMTNDPDYVAAKLALDQARGQNIGIAPASAVAPAEALLPRKRTPADINESSIGSAEVSQSELLAIQQTTDDTGAKLGLEPEFAAFATQAAADFHGTLTTLPGGLAPIPGSLDIDQLALVDGNLQQGAAASMFGQTLGIIARIRGVVGGFRPGSDGGEYWDTLMAAQFGGPDTWGNNMPLDLTDDPRLAGILASSAVNPTTVAQINAMINTMTGQLSENRSALIQNPALIDAVRLAQGRELVYCFINKLS